MGEGPLYVDDLALHYLDTTRDSSAPLGHLSRNLFCRRFCKRLTIKQLIDAAKHGDEIAGVIDRLRKRIRDGVQSEQSTLFLPESSDRESRKVIRHLDALLDLFTSSGIADVICIDDRTFGKYGTDEHGRRVIGSIEVLEYLCRTRSNHRREKTYMLTYSTAQGRSRVFALRYRCLV